MNDHPLTVGALVAHYGQQWAWGNGIATGTVSEVKGPFPDGSWEYAVTTTQDTSRRPGPDNPETRRAQWSSCLTIPVEQPSTP